jgi:hypothetical protein
MAEHLKGAIRERAPYVDVVIGPGPAPRRAFRGSARWPRRRHTRLDRYETYEARSVARDVGA